MEEDTPKGKTPPKDIIRNKSKLDAAEKIADETTYGKRREIPAKTIRNLLQDVDEVTGRAYDETEERVIKEGTIKGKKVS